MSRNIIPAHIRAFALPVWFAWDPLLPYFAAVLLLAFGVSIAMKKAPSHVCRLDKIVLCGPVFIAMPMGVFATEHFLDPVGVSRIIPAWIPAHVFWVYLVGVAMTLGALSIVFQRYDWLSAGLFGIQLLCFEALMHIPRIFAAPHNRLTWAIASRDLFFSLGALCFAAIHAERLKAEAVHWFVNIARVLVGIILIFFAVEHFLHPEVAPGVPLRQLTPTWIPGHLGWSYLTSTVYLMAGVCLIINEKARLAATWAGVWILFLAIAIGVPITINHGTEIGTGLNNPIDMLLLSGAAFCLAASQRKQSTNL